MTKTKPTPQLYEALQYAYDAFNRELFDSALDNSLITLQRQANTYGYMSYNRFAAVGDRQTFTHELALNPDFFGIKPLIEVLQTMVHEMCHLWQFQYGSPSQKSYHNQEWATKMESIGLMPSDTGRVGGKKTGQKMADYPMAHGDFTRVCNQLFDQGFIVAWYDRFVPRNVSPSSMLSDREFAAEMLESAPEHLLMVPHLSLGSQPEATNDGGTCNDGEAAMTVVVSTQLVRPKPINSKCKFSCSCGDNLWGKPTLDITCNKCETKFVLMDGNA